MFKNMKAKINKQCLLKSKGYFVEQRYSDTENTDHIGRWARVVYYNGFCIAWIHGSVKGLGINKLTGKVDLFIVHLQFPCSANQGGDSKTFDTLDESIKYTKEMFQSFKKLINE